MMEQFLFSELMSCPVLSCTSSYLRIMSHKSECRILHFNCLGVPCAPWEVFEIKYVSAYRGARTTGPQYTLEECKVLVSV